MISLIVCLCILGIIVTICLRRPLRSQIRSMPTLLKTPGPPCAKYFPCNMHGLYDTPAGTFRCLANWSKLYAPLYKLWILCFGIIVVCAPEDCELVLSNSKHINKGPIYDLLQGWLGNGLLTSSDRKWQKRRRILTPAFHFSILQQFVTIFNEETASLVNGLKRECHKPHIMINDHITECTLKTIAETSMGTKLDFATKEASDYKKAIIELGEILVFRFLRPWLIVDLFYWFHSLRPQEIFLTKLLHKFTRNVIAERQKNFLQNSRMIQTAQDHEVYMGRKRLAMLDLMLSAKFNDGSIDDEGIGEEVDTFMFEGHDTTSSALSFAIMLLACHRNYQELIYQEMVEVLGDVEKKPTYADLQEMKLLERYIKESLRLYPSVYFIARELGEEMTTSTGHVLSKETIMFIHIYGLHRNPTIYPDPEKFDPDRFLPENTKNRHPFAYLPFSAGARNCIGQKFAMLELKTVIMGILRNFILEPIDTPETISLIVDIILRSEKPIRVKFVPRQKKLNIQ